MKKYHVYVLSTKYATEDENFNIHSIHASIDGARDEKKADKKRIKKQGLIPYESDYKIEKIELKK